MNEERFARIIGNISRCTTMPYEQQQKFLAALEVEQVPKKTQLLRAGEVCDFEAYVNKGCIRSYFLDEHGHEVTLQFATEDWWVSDVVSMAEGKPSRIFIEALEDSELLCIHRDKKEDLYRDVPGLERVFRMMLQRNLGALQDRLFATMAWPAEERYEAFLKRFPQLPNRVPQHMIASYLGITAEFLSKLRARRVAK